MERRDLEKDIQVISAVRGNGKQGKRHYRERECRKEAKSKGDTKQELEKGRLKGKTLPCHLNVRRLRLQIAEAA